MKDDFSYLVLEIVNEIPEGRVVSYKQLAQLAGCPRNARLIGRVMSRADYFGKYPCHRVVHSDGTLVSFWREQRLLLEKEGISFRTNGKVNMKLCQWRNEDGI